MSTTSKKSKYNAQTSNLVYFDPYSISVIKDRINFERNRQKLLLINQYTGWNVLTIKTISLSNSMKRWLIHFINGF